MTNRQTLMNVLLAAALLLSLPASAQSVTQPAQTVHDSLTLDATVFTEVIPDLAVITLAAEAQGVDAAPITREVQQIINAALAQAKATAGVEARTGAFATTDVKAPMPCKYLRR